MLVGDEAALFQEVHSEVRQRIDPLMARLADMTIQGQYQSVTV